MRKFHHGGALALLAVVVVWCAACSSSITAVPPTPGLPQRGQWTRPQFPNVTLPTVSAVSFADADQHIGYACAATLATPAATPTATTTVTASGTVTPSPTSSIPGRPTPPASTAVLANTFWHTQDGGVTWSAATVPPGMPDLLCPLSAIVMPDASDPSDVFLLAAQGTVDLTSPTPTLPDAVSYQLWRSLNGGQLWQNVPLPTVPAENTPVPLSPYHLVILANGQTIWLASNDSGADALFSSPDGGKSWIRHSAVELTNGTTGGTLIYAGFAAGAAGTLDVLATSSALAQTAKPYEIWQYAGDGSVRHIGDFASPIASNTQNISPDTQLFSSPDGKTLYAIIHAQSATPQTGLVASDDGGIHWSAIDWPASPTTKGATAGGNVIATLGENFTVAASGTAYFAPSNSDLPPSQDPLAQASVGVVRLTLGTNTDGSLSGMTTMVATPPTTTNTLVGLAVSLTPDLTLTPGATASAVATATVAVTPIPTLTPSNATPSPTVAVTPTPGATTTPGATVTPGATTTATTVIPNTTGLPTVWTNFGPPNLYVTDSHDAGFFYDILP